MKMQTGFSAGGRLKTKQWDVTSLKLYQTVINRARVLFNKHRSNFMFTYTKRFDKCT